MLAALFVTLADQAARWIKYVYVFQLSSDSEYLFFLINSTICYNTPGLKKKTRFKWKFCTVWDDPPYFLTAVTAMSSSSLVQRELIFAGGSPGLSSSTPLSPTFRFIALNCCLFCCTYTTKTIHQPVSHYPENYRIYWAVVTWLISFAKSLTCRLVILYINFLFISIEDQVATFIICFGQ